MYHGSRAGIPAALQRTELQRLIGKTILATWTDIISSTDRACDPSLFEPNLAINLEVSDYINQKKGN